MKFTTELNSLIVAILIVMALTFIPHSAQSYIIDIIDRLLGIFLHLFNISSSMLDTKLFISNLGHLTVFCLLGYTVARFGKRYSIPFLISVLVLFAILSEISQMFVAGREPSINDLVINISAVIAGLLTFLTRKRAKRRLSKS